MTGIELETTCKGNIMSRYECDKCKDREKCGCYHDCGSSLCSADDYTDGFFDGVEFMMGKQPQWINVEDELPKGNVMVFARTKNGACHVTAWLDTYFMSLSNVTHWMPVPELPTTDKTE